MANFDLYFPKLLELEGGFVDHPLDKGGPTNKGITFATLKRFAPALGVPGTVESLKDLTDNQARVIYKAGYWDVVRGDDLTVQELAEMLCDFAVTSRPATAVRELQRAINYYFSVKIQVDGIAGPVTLAWCNDETSEHTAGLYAAFRDRRMLFYRRIVAKDQSQEVFLNGWINRVNRFPSELTVLKPRGKTGGAVRERLAREIAGQLWIASAESNPDLQVGHALDAARKFVDQCIEEGLL